MYNCTLTIQKNTRVINYYPGYYSLSVIFTDKDMVYCVHSFEYSHKISLNLSAPFNGDDLSFFSRRRPLPLDLRRFDQRPCLELSEANSKFCCTFGLGAVINPRKMISYQFRVHDDVHSNSSLPYFYRAVADPSLT